MLADGVRGQPVVGWRVFAIGDAGALLPPFTRRYWPTVDQACRPWGGTGRSAYWLALAHCAATSDHAAPDEACTCGLRATEELAELLAAVTDRNFAGSTASILDECGVIARVKLMGKVLPGVDMPVDDPLTTWRASQAMVLDLHLAPGLERHREALEDRYAVSVATYGPDRWPHAVAPLPAPVRRADVPGTTPAPAARTPAYLAPTPARRKAFCEAIRPLGFGSISAFIEAHPEELLPIALDTVDAMRGGVTPTDAGRVLFDGPARPTWEQVRAFVLAAVEHLAPDLVDLPDGGPVFTSGVSRSEGFVRRLSPVPSGERVARKMGAAVIGLRRS